MKIKKGTHAPMRLPSLLLGYSMIGYRVTFTESCRYDIGSDQSDINKLFGIGYFSWRLFGMKTSKLFGRTFTYPWFRVAHHDNSVRFGWRYSHGLIEIMAYWYHNGNRYYNTIKDLEIGKPYILKLHIMRDWHSLMISESLDMKNTTSLNVPVEGKNFGYLLSCYFGGNKTAPHDMEIRMERM